MKNTTIFAIALLAVISGCSGEVNKSLSGDYVAVNVAADHPDKKLILQDIMDVEYIPLETTDEFITDGTVMDIGEQYIITKNHLNDGNIFLFDRKSGKAIRKINRFGQSPEEYPGIGGITLDEDNNEIFVKNTNRISVYDLHGNFKRSLNLVDSESDYIDMFDYDKDNLIVYDNKGYGMVRGLQPNHLIISKQDGSVTREIQLPSKGYKTVVVSGENGETAMPQFYPTTPGLGDWILMNVSSDTIYSYSANADVKPFIVREPSIYSMDKEIFLFVVWVTDQYYFMRTMSKDIDPKTMKLPITHLVYDKQYQTTYEYEIYNNDFLYERPVYWTTSVNHEIVTWYPFDASELTEAYKEGNLKGRIKEIAAELDEESNPVIMLIKQKKGV